MARRDPSEVREHLREYRQRYYLEHRDEIRAKQSAYQKARLLGPSGDHIRALRLARVKKSRALRPRWWKLWDYASRWRLKAELVAAYGGSCVCCGETALMFLTIDHVNRDGKQHREKFGGRGSSRQIYLELKRLGWPQDNYRLMCMNCNWATRYGQPCPHLLRCDTHLAFAEVV